MRINHDRLTPNGSSFKAIAEKDFLTTSDGWFRPVSEQVGPDGALWVADWYNDKYPCYQNAQADPEGVDREKGRIWRVLYTGKNAEAKISSRPQAKMDLAKLSDQELVKLLEHENIWQRRMAQRLLAERAHRAKRAGRDDSQEVDGQLATAVTDSKRLETKLAALWSLHAIASDWGESAKAIGPKGWPELLIKFTQAPEPSVKVWTIRFLGETLRKARGSIRRDLEDRSEAEDYYSRGLERLKELATDPDPSVRCAVAVACREIVSSSLTVDTDLDCEGELGTVLAPLFEASKDAKDPLIPYMIWMAGEPGFAQSPQGGLDWLAENGAESMPLSGILARKGMRRLCDTEDKSKMDMVVGFLRKIASASDSLTLEALDGLIEGQKAKPLVPDVETASLFTSLSSNPDPRLRERGRELGTLWGNAASIEATLKAINDSNLTVEQRKKAIAAAKTLKNEAATDALLKVLSPRANEILVIEAIRALGEIGGDVVADRLLGSWSHFNEATKTAAAEVLVSRRRWAIELLSAIEAKRINPMELPISAVRALADSKDDFIRQRAAQAIGRIRPANADKQKIIEEKKAMILKGGPPDLKAGYEIAKKTCFVCHKLNGEGADVGPDLTGVGRSSLDALLVNVIDPNLVVGKGYENVIIETRDGQTVSGRMVENTESRVKLLSSGPKEEVVAKSDIQAMRVSEMSVMPEGLEQMPDQDFRNLILYVLNAGQGK